MSKVFRALLAAGAVVLSVLVVDPFAALAGTGTSVTPTMPANLTIGDTGVPVSITIGNVNTGDEENLDNTVCNTGDNAPCPPSGPGVSLGEDPGINAILSCGQANFGCNAADPGVFAASPTGLGATGSSCEGVVFTIEQTDPTFDTLRFTPVGPPDNIAVPWRETCTIDFTVDVLKLPTVDADPAFPGVQTLFYADNTQFTIGAQGSLPNNASGTDSSTISLNVPTFATDASETAIGSAADGVVGNVILNDTAFVLNRVNADVTGTVSFRLYGPDDDDCTGTPIFEDLDVPIPTNVDSVESAPFEPTLAGTYRWIGTYNGDESNAAVSGECNDPNETSVVNTASPMISTTASADVVLGNGDLVDTAIVSGTVLPQPGATVTFDLYGPDDADCSDAPVFTSTVPFPVTAGPVLSAAYTPNAAGSYQWVASYSGDQNNSEAVGLCGDVAEITDVSPTTPEIVTQASPDGPIGSELTDTAEVTGLVNPIGSTIDFRLYGPDDADCSNPPVFTSLGVPFGPDATTVSSAPFTPTAVGTYRWVATYNGDANNSSAVGVCGDPTETTVIRPSEVQIATEASPGTTVGDGQALTDRAVVTGRVDPDDDATIDFRLYGPNDVDCSGAPIFTSLGVPYPAAGGTVTSAAFVPTLPGVYRWVATYSGDSNNAEAVGICGDPAETVSVTPEPDVTVELPATGQGGVGATLAVGFGALLAGIALLGFGRRRTFSA